MNSSSFATIRGLVFTVVENPGTSPKPIAIGVHRFVGTALGILGLASSGLEAELSPKSAISRRILKRLPGPF